METTLREGDRGEIICEHHIPLQARLIDVRTPSAPVEVGFSETPSAALSVAVVGDYAFVGDQTGELRAFDVSAPSAPVEAAAVATLAAGDSVEVADGQVYLATAAGLYILHECAALDARVSFTPAVAVAAGAEGAFFAADLEINNRSSSGDATVTFGWLPRGTENPEYLTAGPVTLGPYGNNRINRILRPSEPLKGSVEVWSDSESALYCCDGSVVDNLTSDPTTVPPQ